MTMTGKEKTMPNKSPQIVIRYRKIVCFIALGYWLYLFSITSFDAFGWQFRFLTIWALTSNVVVAWLMLRLALGHSQTTWNSLVSATVVLNMVVVFLYWKLYLTNPNNIYPDGPVTWYLEYYLHALGPILMWIDAFLILGVFRRLGPTIGIMLAMFLAYIFWIELLVSQFNTHPVGSVTNGLPYPFLNDMDLGARINFYGMTLVSAIVLSGISLVIMKIIDRFRRSPSLVGVPSAERDVS